MQTHYFVKFYGDALDDTGVDVELASDGGYVVAGTTVRPTGDTDIMLIIVNNYGIQKTQTVYYGEEGDEICTGLLLVDDGYVITGSVTNGGEENVLLVKIGTDGVLDWSSSWQNPGRGTDIVLINNNIVVSGYLLNAFGVKRPMILTSDALGNKIDLYSPTDNPGDYFTAVQTRNNQIFGFGTSINTAINNNMFIAGPAIEPSFFNLSGNEASARIIKGSTGGFFIIGTTDPVSSGTNQIIVKKVNDDFSEDLTFNANPIGNNADFRGVDIQEMEDGRIAVLGDKTFSKDTDIVLYLLNPDGSILSSKIYGRTGNQSASAVKSTPDGGLIILGSNQQEKTNSMITLIKTDKDGNIWE